MSILHANHSTRSSIPDSKGRRGSLGKLLPLISFLELIRSTAEDVVLHIGGFFQQLIAVGKGLSMLYLQSGKFVLEPELGLLLLCGVLFE
jgi:hypothetical protein